MGSEESRYRDRTSPRTFKTPLLRTLTRAVSRTAFVLLAAVLFYAYLAYSETGTFPTPGKNAGGYFWTIIIGMAVGFSLYGVNRMLNRHIPWTDHFASRFLVGFVSSLLVTLVCMMLFSKGIATVMGSEIFWPSTSDDPDVQWKVVILAGLFVFIYNVIYTLLYAYQHYAITQLSQMARDRKQLELQFDALKRQISPHYLFNNLNTISSLLMKDLATAEQFIRRLAQTYQYVLDTQDKKFVLLREELDFVQSYYYLLRMRFQQHLHVEVNIPTRILETRIPPLTLQMLVENAVKHNHPDDHHEILVYITVQDNTWLKVINTRANSPANVPSFHLGLDNIRQRYQYLTEKPVLVENNEKFIVSLPVIPIPGDTTSRKQPPRNETLLYQ